MHKLSFWLIILVLAGCAKLPSSSTSAGENSGATFHQLADDYLKGYLDWRPQMGVGLGFHQYDGKAPDYSRPSLDSELTRLKSFERRLGALNAQSLGPRDRHDYHLLLGAIRREIFGFEQLQVYSRNPMTYAGTLDVSVYIKRNFAPLTERARSIISLLNAAPGIMAAARANLADTLPRPEVETAVEQANGAADFLGKDLVDALKDLKDDGLQQQFRASNQRAMGELRSYATYLKEQKLSKADENYALGREKYVQLLRAGEMVTIAPEELLEIGMKELRHQQEAFAQAARIIDPRTDPKEVFKAIQKDHPTEQSLIPDTAQNLEMIRQFVLEHKLVTLPSNVRAQVKETPQFERATSFASMDTPGPFETKATEAYYYVTPVEPDWSPEQKDEWLTAFNYYTTDIVSIHEVYPGHYVQFLCLNASSADRLEKIFGSYAFSEGWAHYAEQMMVDEGFGRGGGGLPEQQNVRAAKYHMAQADEALLRVCRLCVSIKMHCQGMTVDGATQFFQDNCYYEKKPAHQEAVRGTFDPEYLYYTLGKLEIFKLREDYRNQEGSRFSLERFHNELLRHGAPPLRLVRELMLKDAKLWDKVL